MREQEYNNLITTVSSNLATFNQLLYEILILITIYIYLERIETKSFHIEKNSYSVILLFIIISLSVDWLIWSNSIQTILFGAILFIFVKYKMDNMQLVSKFINITGEQIKQIDLLNSNSSKTCNKPTILAIPEMVDLPYDITDIKPFGIKAYDKTENSINSIQEAYQSNEPPLTITDSNYARIMLNELYQTPQYQQQYQHPMECPL